MLVRRVVAMLLCLGLTVVGTSALAAPTPKDRAQAKSLWTKAKRLVSQQKYDEAIEALYTANELDPKAQYQLDLARALAEDAQLVEARELAKIVVESAEPNTQRAKQAAQKLVEQLDGRIPTLRVVVTGEGAQRATATVNGEDVEKGKDLPFDPGPYLVKARVGAGPEAQQRVELKEGTHPVVTLDLASPGPKEEPRADEGGGGTMVPAAIAYGVGGAGLAVGAVLGVMAFEKTAEVEEACGGSSCPPEYAPDIATAQDYGTFSTVAFAIGGLGVAAGLVLTFTVGMDDDEEAKPKEAALEVAPVFAPGFVGVAGRF